MKITRLRDKKKFDIGNLNVTRIVIYSTEGIPVTNVEKNSSDSYFSLDLTRVIVNRIARCTCNLCSSWPVLRVTT